MIGFQGDAQNGLFSSFTNVWMLLNYFRVINSKWPLQILEDGTAGRNRLSAEPWLGGDNRLCRLNMWGRAAWLSGLVATLAILPE